MVEIIKRNGYYYLGHSIKERGKIKKEETYLGKTLPKDMKDVKSKFMIRLITKRYENDLEKIRRGFSKELKTRTKPEKEKYLDYFMIKFTYDSTRIEGSTLTLKETAALLEEGRTPKDRPISDVKETERHKDVFYKMIEYEKDLNIKTILEWHKGLLLDTQDAIAGKIRRSDVRVAGSKAKFPPHQSIYAMLNKFFEWYDNNKKNIHPVILSALVHLKFVSLHPFGDGNGRISRIMMNFVLHKAGYPMLNIKYKGRQNYYNALERSQITKEDYHFIQHIVRRYIKEYLKYTGKP